VGQYFGRLPEKDYLPTWYDLRTDVAKALNAWPDTDAQGHSIQENAKRRAAEKNAADKAAKHSNTPTVAHFDTLGRSSLTIAHNRFDRNNGTADEKYPTRVLLDIEGNQREVRDAIVKNGDALGRIVMQYDHDMLGNVIHQASMEAGERWMLNDVTGKPIRAWDSRGFQRRMTYDELRRPTGLYVTENAVERLAEETIYGESQGDGRNHRTRVYQVRDGAGVVSNIHYDFKGNLLESKRELLPLSIYKQVVNWTQNPSPSGGTFTNRSTFDALNRPLSITSPDGSIYRPTFNEANLLDKVDVNLRGKKDNAGQAVWTSFVTNVNYNAKGQRELIAYGNGAQTIYDYDPPTFRLIHLKTTRPTGMNGLTSQLFSDPTVMQDPRYTYDPVGNISSIQDVALKVVHHDNQSVEPESTYRYDASYRLIEAHGREHIGQTAHDFNPASGNYRDYPFAGLADLVAHPNDVQKLRHYTERYEYDEVGNFKFMRHTANEGSWTRSYEYEEDSLIEPGKQSNRLTKTTVDNGVNQSETYRYTDAQGQDVHGCMTAINNRSMVWDFKDQLQQVDLGGGGTAYYVYDAGGQRVRKVIETQHGRPQKERTYLGVFEVYREYNGNGSRVESQRESLHVRDNEQRLALVETRTIVNGKSVTDPSPVTRYQFGNHLGSASVELSEDGSLISYEEYHPYGTPALQAGRSAAELSLKRYRYTGKERDEETGLYFHGARYYASWLGRWTACDPGGLADVINLYMYVRGNPIIHGDFDGLQTAEGPYRIQEAMTPRIKSTTELIREAEMRVDPLPYFARLHGRTKFELRALYAESEALAEGMRHPFDYEGMLVMTGDPAPIKERRWAALDLVSAGVATDNGNYWFRSTVQESAFDAGVIQSEEDFERFNEIADVEFKRGAIFHAIRASLEFGTSSFPGGGGAGGLGARAPMSTSAALKAANAVADRVALGGKYMNVVESAYEHSHTYQKKIADMFNVDIEAGTSYVLKGVKFDVLDAARRVLIDAKGPGHAGLFSRASKATGKFGAFIRDSFIRQAHRQLAAAAGTPVEWHVAEKEAADWLTNLFQKEQIPITVVHTK
jgi:RHS repeat-associated protein